MFNINNVFKIYLINLVSFFPVGSCRKIVFSIKKIVIICILLQMIYFILQIISIIQRKIVI